MGNELSDKIRDFSEKSGFVFLKDVVMVSVPDKANFSKTIGVNLEYPNNYFKVKYYVEYEVDNSLYYFKIYRHNKLVYAETDFSKVKRIYNPKKVDDNNLIGSPSKPISFYFKNFGFNKMVKEVLKVIKSKNK